MADKLSNTGITESKVMQVLASNSTDVGALCTSNNINPYSKFKPVKSNLGTMGDNDTTRVNNYKKINYGYTIPTNTLQALTQYMWNHTLPSGWSAEMLENGWVYNKPTGGSSSPYRLGDFREYSHNNDRNIFKTKAFKTSDTSQDPQDVIECVATDTIRVMLDTNVGDGHSTFVVNDLSGITSANTYFGAIISESSSTTKAYTSRYLVTASTGNYVDIPMSVLSNKPTATKPTNIKIMPIFARGNYSAGTSTNVSLITCSTPCNSNNGFFEITVVLSHGDLNILSVYAYIDPNSNKKGIVLESTAQNVGNSPITNARFANVKWPDGSTESAGVYFTQSGQVQGTITANAQASLRKTHTSSTTFNGGEKITYDLIYDDANGTRTIPGFQITIQNGLPII